MFSIMSQIQGQCNIKLKNYMFIVMSQTQRQFNAK